MTPARLVAAAATIGAVALPVATPTAAHADTGSTAATTTAPSCGALPAYVEGRPADLRVRGAAGDYLWHDADGWHLRVTHRTTRRTVFTGVIVASSPMTFQRVRDEAHDKVVLNSDGTRLAFRFVNHGGIDGVDFADSCATTMRFGFAVGGRHLGRNGIYIGSHSARPAHDPFVISRLDGQPAA